MAFITIDGENKIALQQGNSLLLNITHFVLANIAGLGAEPVDRIESMPDIGDIVDTRVVTKSGYVNTNQVVYSLTLDSTIGDYDFNWIGLKDEDDVLIAVIYLEDPISKIASSGGTEGNNLVRNFLLKCSGIQATTAISASAETWQIDFTTRLLQIDERERLSNLDIYGHEAFFSGGFDVTLNAGTVFDVSAGVAYVGGVRCEFTTTQALDVGALPNSIWIDASLQGYLTGKDAIVTLVASNSVLTDYTDGNGVDHYVAKICDITGGSLVTDAKVVTNLVDDHEGKADPHPQYLTEPEGDIRYKPINAIDVPVGSLMIMDGNVVPAGYLKRNGAALSRTAYPALWAYAQSVSNFIAQATKDGAYEVYAGYYGSGNGTTTFTLPDARGEFIRAWDDGRGVDAGRGVGSHQKHAIENITGSFVGRGATSALGVFTDELQASVAYTGNGAGHVGKITFDASNTVNTATETRPRSIAYLFCVKY
tara:strand:+ start:96124 stop:97563 length:1440 start_codon:yes stop_codon:yes gene_type:complete